jgi:hypothetical protein
VYCNISVRGSESFVDDLAVRTGPVSSRVALLLRSAEGQPVVRPDFPNTVTDWGSSGLR